jgi:hypothetical protein
MSIDLLDDDDDDDELEPLPPQGGPIEGFPDDDEFNAWLNAPPAGDETDLDPKLPPKLQEEYERLLAKFEAESPSRLRLAPDLVELERKILYAECNKKAPRVKINRFVAIMSIRGGMGLVIKAYDPEFERFVAIKIWMRPGPETHGALRAEGVALAKLPHRNVVTVYEPGVWNDHPLIVMEWIEGVDGHEWMRRRKRPRSWRKVLAVFIEAGLGLAAAHEAKIQHGDFKPSNILIGEDGRVVVADFGLADSLSSSPEREETLKIAGTVSYMAPERLLGMRGDARSDQFSFCVAIWRALYGQRPFAGETTAELIESIERGEIEETPGVDVPRWLLAVLRKGLALDPDERYRNMPELLDALRNETPPDDADDDGRIGDGEPSEVDGRVLHTPEHCDEAVEIVSPAHRSKTDGAGRRSSGWVWVYAPALAFVAVLGVNMLTRAPTPKPPPAEVVNPYHVILGLVADDKFAEAEDYWRRHLPEVTDEESLRIARACLDRSKLFDEPADREKADEARLAAANIATHIQFKGKTEKSREEGSQLRAKAADHPPASN